MVFPKLHSSTPTLVDSDRRSGSLPVSFVVAAVNGWSRISALGVVRRWLRWGRPPPTPPSRREGLFSPPPRGGVGGGVCFYASLRFAFSLPRHATPPPSEFTLGPWSRRFRERPQGDKMAGGPTHPVVRPCPRRRVPKQPAAGPDRLAGDVLPQSWCEAVPGAAGWHAACSKGIS